MNATDTRLGQYFGSRRERGRDGLPTLSVTLDRGVVKRDSLERKTETALAPQEHLTVRPGDIAYNMMRMWQGASGLVEEEALVSPAYVVLSPKEGVDPRYAAYLFKLPEMVHRFWSYSYGLTGDRLRLYYNDFKRIPHEFPPLREQEKIAEILSTWDKAIETTENLLANAEAERRALTRQLLFGKTPRRGWKSHRLDQLAEINPRRPRDLPEIVSFLSMESVTERGEIRSAQTRPTHEVSKGYTSFIEGDVLVAKITPCFENGKGCHAIGLVNKVGFGSTEFHVLRAVDPRDQRLLFHLTNTHHFRARGEVNMTGSAGQRRVPADYVASYTLPLPDDPLERREVAGILDTAGETITVLERERDALHNEKRALMNQLLTGKRRVSL